MDDFQPGVIEIKNEPIDPLFSGPVEYPDIKTEKPVIPKEYVIGTTYDDSDCEDIAFFTQVELDNTRKCLENTRLIVKDFETQLDWHLEQYLFLRDVLKMVQKEGSDEPPKRQDLLSISQLSAVLARFPECNKKFIKRRGPVANGVNTKKRGRGRKAKESEEEDEDSDDYDEEFDEDDPPPKGKAKRKSTRGRKPKNIDEDPLVVPKDEIEEEIHELVVPKEELDSNEDEGDDDEEMDDDEMDEEEEEEMDEDEEMEEDEEEKKPVKKGKAKTPAKKK